MSNVIRYGFMALLYTIAAPLSVGGAEAEHNPLSARERAGGWILLFDGQTTFGWKASSKADWKVAGGALVVTSGEKGLLHTTSEFADYVLKVDFRSAKRTNSGVFLRTPAVPSDPAGDCYELNIADAGTNPFPTGGLVGRKKAAGAADSQQWQTFEVTAEGGHFTVKLDGRPVLDYTDPKPLGRGYIGLQLNEGKIEFRNVKLKPLGVRSIFNGKDLSGWKLYPEMKSVFSVTADGAMNVKNGRGQIETRGQYGDFVLQLECYSNGKHLNSGVFFRCIAGQTMNGYECQIQNGYRDGDRAKPVDCGTGGFYRRQNARRVVADDFSWFQLTLVATGPHMAAWVNGYPVSDWTDTRNADDNPRRGLRTAAGTLQIQGHDPTTDLSFRKIVAGEMPKR